MEIVLFMVLLKKDLYSVIQAAILGSILANLLLCLGFCFFVGGMRRDEQEFHEVISEVGSGLLLVAGFGLLIPSAFYHSLQGTEYEKPTLLADEVHVSQITAIILFLAYLLYVDENNVCIQC